MSLPVNEQIARLALALLLGGVIGLERERTSHAAGLRTHTLVSVGAALIIIVSTYGFRDVVGTTGVALDPSRVAAQVVSGIGFIGGGTIIVQRANVRGLTTAAGLWTVAAIGLAAGAGLYAAAVATTVIALIILVPLKYAEGLLHHDSGSNQPPQQPTSHAEPPAIGPRRYRRQPGGRRALSR